MPTLIFQRERMPTAVGTLILLTDAQDRLRALDWEDYDRRMRELLRLHYGVDVVQWVDRDRPSSVRQRLDAYFAGDLSAIDAIPVETRGTPFQREVWSALRRIPVGQTVSYGALARQIDRPKAVRAVGMANGANPVGIVVPCHRVIGADASLTGYGGGLARKQWLLEHEGVQNVRQVAA
ncbi:MAG TPA: methylated-DNA--[protein]-cysteine S-methyltransferase [Steroidobacteraceae bacterium]|nr:methylated-DNA--[protein]-cysteine S-methyltransferase [Steroidobacteraceae bacterium]